MKILMILNDPPYGTERSYNALRLARKLVVDKEQELRLFLMGDAVGCAVSGQETPNGYYNLGRMIGSLARKGTPVACCGTCMDARAVTEAMLGEGAGRSSMDGLAEWTLWAERVITF